MQLEIRPLTPDLWPALEDLFGKNGACNGCWCMYWRIGSEYHKRPREKNRNALRKIVKDGPPPGLLGFHGDRVVGWCQLTPREDLSWLQRTQFFQEVDDAKVWSISCFFVRRGYKRKGIMTAFIAAALKEAKRAKVDAVEAYPVDPSQPKSTTNIFTGYASVFKRAGFKMVVRRVLSRPIMRHDLR